MGRNDRCAIKVRFDGAEKAYILDKKFVARPRFENDDEIISAEITELYYVKRDMKMLNGITDGFEL